MIKEDIKKVTSEMKEEIRQTEEKGKRHPMTEKYVDMIAKELIEKINNFTKKNV